MGDWSAKIEIGAVYGEARVPLAQSEACLFVELWDDDKNYARTMAALKPVKKWKAGFMLSSHEDLGYQDYVTRLAAGSCAHMELALDYMDAFPDYHYFIEHMNCLRTVMAYRGDARKRRAARWLPAAETLNAALGRSDGATRAAIDDALDRMCTFDDHCWATEIKHPTDMHRSNHQYVKEQNARVAEKTVRDALNGLLSRDGGKVSVF